MTAPLLLFRPKRRRFSVLDRTFEVPILNLRPLLRVAERQRKRANEPNALVRLVDSMRSRQGRLIQSFRRAHEVLDAQDDVVYAAIDHVDANAAALSEAATWIGAKARDKLRQLAAQANERRRLTENARLGDRGEMQLARDLELVSGHMRHVARTAALCLARLSRFRRFVDAHNDSLAQREQRLAQLRAELVHDEQTWRWRDRLEKDGDLTRWAVDADALCQEIGTMLEGLHRDLSEIETHLHDVPVSFARLIDGDMTAAPALLNHDLPTSLPGIGDIPMRLDDEDWQSLEAQHIEAELIFDTDDLGALKDRAESWLGSFEAAILAERRTPPCARCRRPVASASTHGRAHLLCGSCRESSPLAAKEHNPGLETTRAGGLQIARAPVTREEFDAVMGWVPERASGKERLDLPLTRVTWLEAIAFCNALSRRQGLPEAYRVQGRRVRLKSERGGWRLPTHAEWRDFTVTRKDPRWWTDPDRTWHAENTAGTIQPVHAKAPNPIGLYDTLGNAAEWLWASPSDAETKGKGGRQVRSGFGADERIAAGGGFVTPFDALDPDSFLTLVIEARDVAVGFRPVRDIVEVPAPGTAKAPAGKGASKRTPRPKATLSSRPRAGSGVAASTVFGVVVTLGITGVIAYHSLGMHDPGPPEGPLGSLEASAPSESLPAAAPSSPGTAEPTGAAAPTTPERARAEALLERAFASRDGRDRPKTLGLLRQAVAADPNLPAAHLELARELAQMRRNSEATRQLRRLAAIRGAPDEGVAAELLREARDDPDFQHLTVPHPRP